MSGDSILLDEMDKISVSEKTTSVTNLLTNAIETTTVFVTNINEKLTTAMDQQDSDLNKSNNKNQLLFSTIDYWIFTLMLISSALIGLYFGFYAKKKQDNTQEYLLGGKTMNIFPVSASLIASHVSGITLLGVPTEMYVNGTQYWMFVVPVFCVSFAMIYLYLPIFYDLQLTSCFTYLEKRFDRSVRVTASLVYGLSCLVFIPIVIYVPALALSQVTGINIHLITPLICAVCIFYTTVGGLRAVVWTDTLQFVLMIGAILAVIILGTISVGSFWDVWEKSERGGRLIFFNMDPDPLLRTSFWTVACGLSIMWISNLGCNQGCIQRFLSVPNIRKAKQSVWILGIGLFFIKSCSCFTGLLMYAKYETCDPVAAGTVKKVDQILPYFVMDVGGKIPGLPGLFIAGIFSAALSTMSSNLNTLSGTIYEDFLRHRLPNATEKTASNIMKITCVILGIIELSLVFMVEKLGSVLHVAISFSGVTAGTLLGMFTMGMVLPKANKNGVIWGAITSIAVVGTILIGAQSAVKPPGLPIRTDGCDEIIESLLVNTTLLLDSQKSEYNDIHPIFRISFMYYSLIGVLVVFIVGYPISLLTGGCDILDQRLLATFIRDDNLLRKQQLNKQYTNIDVALNELKKLNDADNI